MVERLGKPKFVHTKLLNNVHNQITVTLVPCNKNCTYPGQHYLLMKSRHNPYLECKICHGKIWIW